MVAPWPVAALAINSLRQAPAKARLAPRCVVAGRHFRVAVMAEHAAEADLALESQMLR
jgi:hypothetical protein